MEDIRSWWEVPSIAHFCSLFRTAFGLTDFEIEDLEDALLLDGAREETYNRFLADLHARLLKGLFTGHGNKDINAENFELYLSEVLKIRWEDDLGKKNPLSDQEYSKLTTGQKVEILHNLCDFRLDVGDVPELLKGLDANSLRVEPLGSDASGSVYWYFYGTRLYKETSRISPEDKEKNKGKRKKKLEAQKKKKKRKRLKGKKKKKGSSSSDSESDFVTSSSSEEFSSEDDDDKSDKNGDSEEDKQSSGSKWMLVCSTANDWEELAECFKKSKHRDEKLLYQTLTEDFIPEITKMIETKEKVLQKKLLLEMAPRRASERIALKVSQRGDDDKDDEEEKQQEKERLADQKKQEEDEKQKEKQRLAEKRQQERAERARLREERQWLIANGELASEFSMDGSDDSKDNEPKTREHIKVPISEEDRDEDLYTGMYKVLDYLKKHNNAWPFLEPVDESYAPQYNDIIENPMDLSTVEEKLDNTKYMTLDDFQSDMKLMFENCLEYNGPDSMYTKMGNTLEAAFNRQLKKHFPEDQENSDEDFEEELQKSRKKERGKRRSDFYVDDYGDQTLSVGQQKGSTNAVPVPFQFPNNMVMNQVPNPMMAARHHQEYPFPPGAHGGFGPDGRPVYPPQFYQNMYNAALARYGMPPQQQFNQYQYPPPPLTRAPMGNPQGMGFSPQAISGHMPYPRPPIEGVTQPGPHSLPRMQGPQNRGAHSGQQTLTRMQGPPSLGARSGPQTLTRMQGPPSLGACTGAQIPTSSHAGGPPGAQMPLHPAGAPVIKIAAGMEVPRIQMSTSQLLSKGAPGLVEQQQSKMGSPTQYTGQPRTPGATPPRLSVPLRLHEPSSPVTTGVTQHPFMGYPGTHGPPRLQRVSGDRMPSHRLGPPGSSMPPQFGGHSSPSHPPLEFLSRFQAPSKVQGVPASSTVPAPGSSSSVVNSPISDAGGEGKRTPDSSAAMSPVQHTIPVSTSAEPTPSSLTTEKEKREPEQAGPSYRPQSFGQPFPPQAYYNRAMAPGLQQATVAPFQQGMVRGPSPWSQGRHTSVIMSPPAPSTSDRAPLTLDHLQRDIGKLKNSPQYSQEYDRQQSEAKQQNGHKEVEPAVQHTPLPQPPKETGEQQPQQPRNKGVGLSIRQILGSPSRDSNSDSERGPENKTAVIMARKRSPPPLVSDRLRRDEDKSEPEASNISPVVEPKPQQTIPTQQEHLAASKSWPPAQLPQGPSRPKSFLEELFNGAPPPASKELEEQETKRTLERNQRTPFTSLLKEMAPQRESPTKKGTFVDLNSTTQERDPVIERPVVYERTIGGMNQAHKDFIARNFLRNPEEAQRYVQLSSQINPYGMYAGKRGPETIPPLQYRPPTPDMAQMSRQRAFELAAQGHPPKGQFVDLDGMQYREQPGYPSREAMTRQRMFLLEQRRQQEQRMPSSRGPMIHGQGMHMMGYPDNMILRQQQLFDAMYSGRMLNGDFPGAASEDTPPPKIPRFS